MLACSGARHAGISSTSTPAAIGSKPKMVHIFSALMAEGVPASHLAEVRTPVGLGIGAQSPEEIAVSILAEMIAVRHGVDPSRAGSLRAELPGRMKVGA